jgi:Glucose dehydrogenase
MQSLWMVAAGFLFACMAVCVKLAAEQYSVAEIFFYRSAISLFYVVILLRMYGISIKTPLWILHILRSGSGSFAMSLNFCAISLLPLATATTLSYTSPLFLAFFLAVLGKVRLNRGKVFALTLGFFGVILLLHPTFNADQLFGGAIGLLGGMFGGFSFLNIKELALRGERDERIVFYFSLVGTVVGLIWTLFLEFHPINLKGGLLLLGTGVFGVVAQLMMTRAYSRGNTLVTASLAYMTVVFAGLFGVILWNDILGIDACLAIFLIAASGVMSTWFSRLDSPPRKPDI